MTKRETSMKLKAMETAVDRGMALLMDQRSIIDYLKENFENRQDNEPTDHNGAVAYILAMVSQGISDSVEILDKLQLAMGKLSKAEQGATESEELEPEPLKVCV